MSEAQPYPNRLPITASLVLATLMNTLDSTIANVALPHIQGSMSAASDEVVWVLTSYIVAAAMTTPVSGWFANRFGIKRVFLVTISGFTISSVLCGLASTAAPQASSRASTSERLCPASASRASDPARTPATASAITKAVFSPTPIAKARPMLSAEGAWWW